MKLFEVFGDQDAEFSPQFIRGVYDGSISLYDVMQQNTPDGRAVARMYDEYAVDYGYHPDDHFEEILDKMADDICRRMGD